MNSKDMIYLASRESSLYDPNYRYKIKKLDIKRLGKPGNWTTHLSNSEEIAKKINRSGDMFGKYICHAISCPMKFDKETNCLTFKGDYSCELITKHFMEFIKIYVLCPVCDYPETTLFNQKDKSIPLGIYHHCDSCGSETKVLTKSIDKTYEFIEKNIK